jgi:hypothetical protein
MHTAPVSSLMVADAIVEPAHELQWARFERASDAMPDPRFPAFDDWQRMSESEQDSLIAKMERRKRWRDRFPRILVAALLVAAAGTLYLL